MAPEYYTLAVGPPPPQGEPSGGLGPRRVGWMWTLLLGFLMLHRFSSTPTRPVAQWAAAPAPLRVPTPRFLDGSQSLTPLPSARAFALRANAPSHDEDPLPPPSPTVGPAAPSLPGLLGRAALLGVAIPGLGQAIDLDGPLSVVGAIAVITAVIVVHEWGHFAAARFFKIRVAQFNVGLGPPIWQYKGPEVEYFLRAIPAGGYVTFPDDDPKSGVQRDDPDLLRNRPAAQRLAVISGGVIANVFFAFFLLFAQIQTVGIPRYKYLEGVSVLAVRPDSPALGAGLLPNDVIVAIDGQVVGQSSPDRVRAVVAAIRSHAYAPLELTVRRDSEVFTRAVVPQGRSDGQGVLGADLQVHYALRMEPAKNALAAAKAAGEEVLRLGGAVVGGFKGLLTANSGAELSGPVKIVSVGAEVARDAGPAGLSTFAAALNTNLAILNVLPFPGLDGGALFLLLVEVVRGGKKLGRTTERFIQGGGFLFFAACALFVVFKDVAELIFPGP
jgi:membrane-associated protease RseP (regulator of RpoE activity)